MKAIKSDVKDTKNFEAWRAEEIAKVYLLNSNLLTLLPESDDQFDFFAISKNQPARKIAVEVKATKYAKGDIKRVFNGTRNKFSEYPFPVILMYINNDKENGYFEIFNNGLSSHEIEPLETERLREKISGIV